MRCGALFTGMFVAAAAMAGAAYAEPADPLAWGANSLGTRDEAAIIRPANAVAPAPTAVTWRAPACRPTVSNPLTVSRTITIDTKGGPNYGSINYGPHKLLNKNEVVLSFDDGPYPGRTERILKALRAHCALATFFSVGRMAQAYPKSLARIAAAGHTIGTHTWAHANLRALGQKTAETRIEKGFAGVASALGQPISPLFRFPFLSENKRLLKYVKSRDISSISVDVVPGDTRGYGPRKLVERTISGARRFGGGIILYHDIKPATASAMPEILRQLSKNGFKLVHLRTTASYAPKPDLMAVFEKGKQRRLAAALANAPRKPINILPAKLKLPERNARRGRRVATVATGTASGQPEAVVQAQGLKVVEVGEDAKPSAAAIAPAAPAKKAVTSTASADAGQADGADGKTQTDGATPDAAKTVIQTAALRGSSAASEDASEDTVATSDASGPQTGPAQKTKADDASDTSTLRETIQIAALTPTRRPTPEPPAAPVRSMVKRLEKISRPATPGKARKLVRPRKRSGKPALTASREITTYARVSAPAARPVVRQTSPSPEPVRTAPAATDRQRVARAQGAPQDREKRVRWFFNFFNSER